MSVYVASGLILPSAGGTSSTSTTFESLKEEVAVAVDGEVDPVVLDKAGKAINRIVRKMNLAQEFQFNRVQQTDANLVSGTASYSIPDSALIVDEVQLIDSDNEVVRTLDYYPWEDFNQKVAHQSDTGIPRWWTIYNRSREGAIRLYAVPDDTAAADYDLRIHTKYRILELSDSTDQLVGPPELSEVLVTGGEYLILYWRERKNPAAWGSAERRFYDALHDLRRLDRNMEGKLVGRAIDFEE